jgi:glycosyltransferase involved in cell wall biosynthesis
MTRRRRVGRTHPLKIKGLWNIPEGGGLYRIRMPLDELGRHGHDTSCEPALTTVAPGGVDIVVTHMAGAIDHRTAPAVHRWWRRMAMTCRRVYELDDDPFELEHSNPVHNNYNAANSRDSFEFCIRTADLVTTSVQPLADRMRKLNPNVVVLKNRIDESLLDVERPRRDKIVIGWAGGPSHFEDMKECSYGLRRVLDWNPRTTEAHFIGVDMRPTVRCDGRFTRWAKITTDYYKLIDFDIGIAPLRPGVFTDAKSAIKVMEYGALGIPCVASDVTPYRDYVIDGVTGWLVSTEQQWAQRLRELVNDEAMRTEMGAKAKEVASQHTIQMGWRDWEAAYESIL